MTHPVHRPGHVGARFPKVDGAVKADGSGIYADDIHLPRMLHAKILRSPHANARIRGIDVRAAEKYPGVVATLVGRPCVACLPRAVLALEGRGASGRFAAPAALAAGALAASETLAALLFPPSQGRLHTLACGDGIFAAEPLPPTTGCSVCGGG